MSTAPAETWLLFSPSGDLIESRITANPWEMLAEHFGMSVGHVITEWSRFKKIGWKFLREKTFYKLSECQFTAPPCPAEEAW